MEERAVLYSTIMMSYFTKRDIKVLQELVFKPNSIQSLESLPVTKRLYSNNVLLKVNQTNLNLVFVAKTKLYEPWFVVVF